MNVSLSRRRVGTTLTVATIVCLVATAIAAPAGARVPSVKRIQNLAKNAYIWGLAPEFVYRFEKYNDLVTTPRNTLGGGSGVAAAWNNNATNAGDASVLYLNAMLDLSGKPRRGHTKELVMTVPPSQNDYYVVNLLDVFINSMGSIGTRTTPSTKPQTYLLVGPTSKYAHRRTVTIDGFRYRVMASDTNLNWMLIRIRADSLVPPSSTASTASVMANVVKRFGMTTLRRFRRTGDPNYFDPNDYTPSARKRRIADRRWHNAPRDAIRFFRQVGTSLKLNPLPTRRTGLNGIPLSTLPNWVVPQAGAKNVFRNPAFGQKRTLARFKPIGLTANGFKVPSDFGRRQRAALRKGLKAGNEELNDKLSSAGAEARTNYWSYLNAGVGTYANTHQGYIYRGIIVLEGGSANMPEDAVYAQTNNLSGRNTAQLNGDNTYRLTFKPPHNGIVDLPAIGTLPPTVNDSSGNPRGFWSIHVYQVDKSESAAPFLTQPSVLNTSYSSANIDVSAVDPSTDTLTVQLPQPQWGPLLASTPVLFGPTAAQYGLTPGVPYYLVDDATENPDGNVLVPGVDRMAAGAVVRRRTDPGSERQCRCDGSAAEPGRARQPAVGPDPAGLAARLPAAHVGQACAQQRRVGDALARADAARGRNRDQLDPDTVRGLLREHLRGRAGREAAHAHGNPAADAHLLPEPGEHPAVDPAAARREPAGHLRVPEARAGEPLSQHLRHEAEARRPLRPRPPDAGRRLR